MANLLAIGIATLDIINIVEHYPEQDSEVRALKQHQTRGGNATNTLSVLSQLGHQCHWAGVLIHSADSQAIIDNLAQHHINTDACWHKTSGKMPTSYITLAQDTASRTIVHFRDCPEYDFDHFKALDLTNFDWIHFEGRHIAETKRMLKHLKKCAPDIPCSIEIEKERPDIQELFPYADILFFSQHYAESQGYYDPSSFLADFSQTHPIQASCTWGAQGAWAIDATGQQYHYSTKGIATVDTLGAGDTFNAAMIDQLSQQYSLEHALNFATQLASHKCQQFGLDHLLSNFTFKETR